MTIRVEIEELVRCLSSEDVNVRVYGARALGEVVEKGVDVSIAIPALVKALSDENDRVRKPAAWALGKAAEKAEIDLGEVKTALTRFVDNEVKRGIIPRKIVEREAAEYYVEIANGVSKRRKAIGMDGLLLDEKIKPPKGPKTYRQKVAV